MNLPCRSRECLVLLLLLGGVQPSLGRDAAPALFSPRSGPPNGPPVNREVLWSQPCDLNGTRLSSEIIAKFGLESEIADDFVIGGDATVRLARIWGGPYNWSQGDPDITAMNLRFYEDDGCLPGGILASYAFPVANAVFVGYDGFGYPTYQYDANVDFDATGNQRYWLMAQAGDHPFPPQWGRQQTTVLRQCAAMFRSDYFGYPNWEHVSDIVGGPFDASFELNAEYLQTEACCFEIGSCRLLPATVCVRDGGAPQGEGSVCDPNPCPSPDTPRACCLDDQTCEVLTAEACAQRGGDPRLPGEDCDPNPCIPAPIPHACCFGSGTCRLMFAEDCIAAGGLPQGACTVCEPNPCPQPGACCFEDGRCEVLIDEACAGQGGVPQGGGTVCEPNPCPQPGACCFADGACTFVFSWVCGAAGGIPQGDGTVCAPNPCPQPGACCFEVGTCRVLFAEECIHGGGAPQGDGSLCDPNPCPPSDVPRACCLPDHICEVLAVGPCVERAGDPQMPGISCDPNPCIPALIPRACCFGNGTCTVMMNEECTTAGGLPQGACSDCSPNPCPQPQACCFEDGHCLFVQVGECQSQGGTPQGNGSNCEPNPCPQPQACCYRDGSCAIALPAVCTTAGGVPQGNGTDCEPNPCPQPQGCCFVFGTCRLYHPLDCVEEGGTPMGDGVACDPSPCAPATQPRACCFDDETCRILSALDCALQGGRTLEAGAACNPNPCSHAVIRHACCFGNGQCSMLTTDECQTQGGLPQGICVTCSPNPCSTGGCRSGREAPLEIPAAAREGKQISAPIPYSPAYGSNQRVEGGRDVCWSEPADLSDYKITSEIIGMFGLESEMANDFVIGHSTTITRAIGYGGYYNWVASDPAITSLNWKFYSDGGCYPDALLDTFTDLGTVTFIGYDGFGYPTYKYETWVSFNVAGNNTYWLGLQAADHPFPPQWGRQGTGFVITGCCTVFRSAYFGYPDWVWATDLVGSPYDAAQEFECGGATTVESTTWGKVKAMFRSAPADGVVRPNSEEVSR